MNSLTSGSGERTLPGDRNRYQADRIYRFVTETNASPNKVALDYGCGSGYGTAFMAGHFGRVFGIDVSPETIEACHERYVLKNLEFRVFEPTQQPFPNSSFDFIGSFQVFEHIPLEGVSDFIQYIWAMLRSGGVAIVTTPNANNYFGGYSGNPFHVKEYRREELQMKFAEVLDPGCFEVFATADVPSTMVNNYVKRALRASRFGSLLGRALCLPLAVAERKGFITFTSSPIVKSNRDDIIGGYLVEIHKGHTG